MTTLLKKRGDYGPELRDLVDQINRLLVERDNELAPLIAMLAIGRPIVAGRCGTNGTGGISFSDVLGARVSVSGTDIRITFNEPRPQGPNGPTYMPFAIPFTAASARMYAASSVASVNFCDMRLRDNAGNIVSAAGPSAVNLALFVLDRD